MSLANIIMQGTAQGLEARSRGIRSLAKGIEKAGDWYQGKEERETKKRYMNAQADAMETSAKVSKKKMNDQNELQTIIAQGQKAGKTTAEIKNDARLAGIGDLGASWYDQTLVNEKSELAAESQKWTNAEQRADEIGMQAMAVKDEAGWKALVDTFAKDGYNITEGIEKEDWASQRQRFIDGSEKVQNVMYKKQQMVMQRGANEVDRLQKIAKDLESKKNRTKEEDDYLKDVKANIETSKQKVAATISLKEENQRMKLEKRKGEYAKTATGIVQSLWSDDELTELTGSRAAMRGETKAIAYASELLEQGVPISEVKRWAAEQVTFEDNWDSMSWLGGNEDSVSYTPYEGAKKAPANEEVASPGKAGGLPAGWSQGQYDSTAQKIAKGEGISLEEAKKALNAKLGM